MLVSENYQKRLWTNHERKAAQSRAFNSSKEYILPIRLDDSTMDTLLDTTGYLDYRLMGNDKVVETLITKLWGSFKNEPSLNKVNFELALLYQRVGLICENSLRSLNDPLLLKWLPLDIYQEGQSMIRNVKEELQFRSNYINHLVLENVLIMLKHCEILIDLCIFLMQRFNSQEKIRVILHPSKLFQKLKELDALLGLKIMQGRQYYPDFEKITAQWVTAFGEENRVIDVSSKLLTMPRNDLLIYDMFTLKEVSQPINGQTYEVYRTIQL
jgi:hypothetical protein